MKVITADEDGEIVNKVPTKELRTRHGDKVNVTLAETEIEFKGAKRTRKYHVPANTIMYVI